METTNCLKHSYMNEIYCTVCKTFLCPECISEHGKGTHTAKYVHAIDFSKDETVKQIDKLTEEAKGKDHLIQAESTEIIEKLQTIVPKFDSLVEMHIKQTKMLKMLALQLNTFSKSKQKGSFVENICSELGNEKKRLIAAQTNKNIAEVVKIANKIERETKLVTSSETVSSMIGKMEKALAELEKAEVYKPSFEAASSIATKCGQLKLVQYQNNWKIDRQYFSSKMFLSEDNLTFGNTASSGYPGIIGDLPFDFGLFAFEVIPTSLECTGREGFGIIERDRYLAIWNSDKSTPEVSNDIIGFLYRNEAKNMHAERMADMVMGSKYYVRVNMMDHKVKITGPGLLLTADLKPDVIYVPCLSCGCSSNRIKIRPLSEFDEDEGTSTLP